MRIVTVEDGNRARAVLANLIAPPCQLLPHVELRNGIAKARHAIITLLGVKFDELGLAEKLGIGVERILDVSFLLGSELECRLRELEPRGEYAAVGTELDLLRAAQEILGIGG